MVMYRGFAFAHPVPDVCLLPELPSPGGMIDQNTESIENSNTPKNNLAKYKT
eukprot:COSAG01_NODE_15994_length_1279_cov_3.369492_2_plen_51_part_01